MSEAKEKNADNNCEAAEEFIKMYYKQIDTQRHQTSKLYLDTGLLVWNGKGIKGNNRIQKFIMDLPASTHVVKTLETHPMAENLTSNKSSHFILSYGDVTFENEETQKPFQQTMVIVAVDGKWKIASDCFKIQVPYPS